MLRRSVDIPVVLGGAGWTRPVANVERESLDGIFCASLLFMSSSAVVGRVWACVVDKVA